MNKVDDDMWTSIGFSEDPYMPSSDIVVGYMNADGEPVVRDMWTLGYFTPAVDEVQDLEEAKFERRNGWNVLKFKKRVRSGDAQVNLKGYFNSSIFSKQLIKQ